METRVAKGPTTGRQFLGNREGHQPWRCGVDSERNDQVCQLHPTIQSTGIIVSSNGTVAPADVNSILTLIVSVPPCICHW